MKENPSKRGRINIAGIVAAWLKQNGYDGLCNCGQECGCWLDDLMPCDEPDVKECEAGHSAADGLMHPGR